jgi:hypothetical protein
MGAAANLDHEDIARGDLLHILVLYSIQIQYIWVALAFGLQLCFQDLADWKNKDYKCLALLLTE